MATIPITAAPTPVATSAFAPREPIGSMGTQGFTGGVVEEGESTSGGAGAGVKTSLQGLYGVLTGVGVRAGSSPGEAVTGDATGRGVPCVFIEPGSSSEGAGAVPGKSLMMRSRDGDELGGANGANLLARSATLWMRRPRSFSRQSRTVASSASGISGRTARIGRGTSVRTPTQMAAIVLPGNGYRPVRSL